MNKSLVFGSVGLLGVSGAVTGISYTSLNLFQKKGLIEELKELKIKAEKSLEKIKNKIQNHKSERYFKRFLKIFIEIENAPNFLLHLNDEMLQNHKNEIESLKQNIEQENQDKNEIKNIFKDIEFFALLIRNMYEKINELSNRERTKSEKFYEIKAKLEKYLEDYKKKYDSEKLESLNDFINDIDQEILDLSDLTIDKRVDNLEKEILIQGEKYKKKLQDLIFKNEKFKNIKEELEVFLNLGLERKKSIICLFLLRSFLLSNEIMPNMTF